MVNMLSKHGGIVTDTKGILQIIPLSDKMDKQVKNMKDWKE